MAHEDGQVGTARSGGFRDPPPFSLEAQGQRLDFFPAGRDRREALFAIVEQAQRSLELCFYIFVEDATGTALRDALVAAAKRGVAVTLIVDRFGASVSDDFVAPLREAGGVFFCFNPHWSQRYLIRNHQKLVIADGEAALFGGFNIEDSYFAPPEENGWNDLAVRIEGPAVAGVVAWFATLKQWTDEKHGHFRAIRRAVREWQWGVDGEPVRWLIGGPTRGLSSWAACVSRDLIQGERLDMFMAYFSPPKRLLRRIGRIAAKGRTRLLMAAKSDNGATLGATRSLYAYLLGRGAQIWEFSPCKLHTKLIVLDDVVYVGSANFDMRSLYLNLEIMLRIEDRALADRMREFMDRHIEASQSITPALHRSRATLWNRIRWNLGWLLVSVIDYTVTRRLNLGL